MESTGILQDPLIHSIVQWAAVAVALGGIWSLHNRAKESISSQVNLERDVDEIRKDLERHTSDDEKDDSAIDKKLEHIEDMLQDLLTRVSRVEGAIGKKD